MRDRRTALVVGATGLVGRLCLERVVSGGEYREVTVIGRRSVGSLAEQGRVREHLIDFAELGAARALIRADHVFCALGTTRAKAGSRGRFREVDLDYPLLVARSALANGARHFSLVSSIGANPRSRFFYLRVKGELEAALAGLGFASLVILRPSLLSGRRAEPRPLERAGEALMALAPRRWRPTPGAAVADTMVALARAEPPGVRIVEAGQIVSAMR